MEREGLTRRDFFKYISLQETLAEDGVFSLPTSTKVPPYLAYLALLFDPRVHLIPAKLPFPGCDLFFFLPTTDQAMPPQLYPEWPVAALRHLPQQMTIRIGNALRNMNSSHPAVRPRSLARWNATFLGEARVLRAFMGRR